MNKKQLGTEDMAGWHSIPLACTGPWVQSSKLEKPDKLLTVGTILN